METIIILSVLALVVCVLVLPIVAVVQARNARRQSDMLVAELRAMQLEIAKLRNSSFSQPRKAEEEPAVPHPVTSPLQAGASAPPPVVEELIPVASPPAPEPPPLPIASVRPPPLPRAEPPPATAGIPRPAPRPAFNWEQFVGVKLFAWVAGIGLFFTAIYFLKYSFDHGWVPPPIRAAMGFLTAAGLIVGGLLAIRRSYAIGGQSLVASGVVTLYAITVACRHFYKFDFFQGPAAGGLLFLTTAAAFLLAVRLNAQVVALLGMLGGFLTPVMLATGVDNPPGLFGFIALLDIGLLAVAVYQRWFYIATLAAVGTAVIEIGWADQFFMAEKLPTAVVVLMAFNLLFSGALGLARRAGRTSWWLAAAAVVPPTVALGFALYFIGLPSVAARAGWFLGNTLVANLSLLAVCALYRPWGRYSFIAGFAAFGVAALCTAETATPDFLNWALGYIVLTAALHAGFPFVLQRIHSEDKGRSWSALFPPLGILVLLVPLGQLDNASWLIWPVLLLLNLLSLLVAALTRVLAAVVAALLLTLVVLGICIGHMPHTGGIQELLILAGFAVFFVAGSFWLLKHLRQHTTGPAPTWVAQLPDASAALPFLLLVVAVLKLNPADPSPIFGVVLLLDILLYGIALLSGRGSPVLAAAAGTLLVEYCWWGECSVSGDKVVALAWFAAFGLGFLVTPFVFLRRIIANQPPWAVAALSLPLHFSLLNQTVALLWPALCRDAGGALPALCALPPLVGLVVLLRTIPLDSPFRLNRLAWFGASALFFITLIFPLQFSAHWLTIGWALEGTALLWLFHRVPHPGLRIAGVGLLVAVFVRLVLNPSVLHYAERSQVPVLNWILGTYGIAAICCFVGGRLLAPPRNRVAGMDAPALLATLGTILAFAMVNFEIADYFTPTGSWVRLEFSGNLARDMSYTIAWALFALGMVVVGVQRRIRAARYAALCLLGATVLKLFLHDTASLETVWRIAAFAVVSIVALAASFLFQRFLRNNPTSNP